MIIPGGIQRYAPSAPIGSGTDRPSRRKEATIDLHAGKNHPFYFIP